MKAKKTLFLTIAISGSGKSWYIKNSLRKDFKEVDKYLSDNNLDVSELVVSPDLMRKELTGDISNKERDAQIWKSLVYTRTKEKLKEHGFCIFDATNLSKRNSFLKHFKNVRKIGLVFKPDVELSIERINEDIKNNVDRSKVPENVVKNQYERFVSSVIYFKWNGVWNKVIKKKIKERLLKEENLEILFV
jgi:predicted kinase